MKHLTEKSSGKFALPPESLIYTGNKKEVPVVITVFEYDKGQYNEYRLKNLKKCPDFSKRGQSYWLNLNGLCDEGVVKRLGDCFDIHPLVLEDILNVEQRPKIEDFGDYLFVVLKMFSFDEKKKSLNSEQISIILGNGYVLSLQEIEGDVLDPIRQRIRNTQGKIREKGADYLFYSIIDMVVDYYFVALEKVINEIENMEDELVNNPRKRTLQNIHSLKSDIIYLRQAVWPLREIIGRLEKSEFSIIGEDMQVYFRDVYEHSIQIMDSVETLRDMISGMLDIYMSSISNRMNDIMKVLTIISTIFIPPTFIAGLYGMNFKWMPELSLPWGYPAALLLMLGSSIAMLVFFKKKKWM